MATFRGIDYFINARKWGRATAPVQRLVQNMVGGELLFSGPLRSLHAAVAADGKRQQHLSIPMRQRHTNETHKRCIRSKLDSV